MIRIYLKFTTVDVVMKFLHPEDNREALLFNLRIVLLSCIESSRDVGNGSLMAIAHDVGEDCTKSILGSIAC